MGKEAKLRYRRKCKECGESKFGSAEELQIHAKVCKIAKVLGLELPGSLSLIEPPDVEIINY